MAQRIVIPVNEPEGTTIAAHFGRAPYFAAIDLTDGTVTEREVLPNTGEHKGGKGHAHDNVMGLSPQVIIVQGMGPRGISGFQARNVAVLRAASTSVEATIDAYLKNELSELTEGCRDARHS